MDKMFLIVYILNDGPKEIKGQEIMTYGHGKNQDEAIKSVKGEVRNNKIVKVKEIK